MKPAAVNRPSDNQVLVTRCFEAKVESVWHTFTDTSLVSQWMLGPPGWSMPVCEFDFRIGGNYKNVFRNNQDASEISIAGCFRQINKLSKIVQEEKHLISGTGDAGIQETIVTMTFNETNRVTTVSTLIEYKSKAARDEALATGMGAAMEMGYRRIDVLLAEQKQILYIPDKTELQNN